MPIIIYQSLHQNTESSFVNRTKVVVEKMFFFETNIIDTWLPRLMYSDRIYPPA